MNKMTVKQLAGKAGINPETIRYYEKIGLLSEPERTESGYRIYSDSDLSKLQFIGNAKYLGFTLKEIRELLLLRVDDETSCDDVRILAEKKMKEIDDKISHLKRIKKSLKKLAAQCHTGLGRRECPILENLED